MNIKTHKKQHFLFSAPNCPPVPIVQNATVDTLLSAESTVLTYTCKAGHVFDGKKQTLSRTCTENYLWSGADYNCEGTNNIMYWWC